jgi:hypothetical protein
MIDLNTKELISSVEASLLWGKQKDYVRTIYNKYPQRFPKGTIRKFGKQLVVTEKGMETVSGQYRLNIVHLNKDLANHTSKEEAKVIGVSEYKLLIKFNNGDILKTEYKNVARLEGKQGL